MTRRTLLALPLGWVLGRLLAAAAETETRRVPYAVRVALLWGALRLEMTGTLDETIDRAGGHYTVHISGQGTGLSTRIESTGILRAGRWAPLRTRALFVVYGRESRSDVAYDYALGKIEYHARSETFLLRRLRVADDVLSVPEGLQVDDVISATLNYAEARWPPGSDARLATHVVRRRRPPAEGPDDVAPTYRAELVPFVLQVATAPETGKPTALFDLTRFSSWARESDPARVVFGPDRRPEEITSSLILGTSITIRIGTGVATSSS